MDIFNATDQFTVPDPKVSRKKVRQTVRAFLEYHKADPITEDGDVLSFNVATFMISGRNKPLHRFSRGQIKVSKLPDGNQEIAFWVRLSPLNIFGCVAAVVAGLLLAYAFFAKPEISLWWSLAAVCAGPLFAYSAKDQSVSRLKGALQEAVALAERDWQT